MEELFGSDTDAIIMLDKNHGCTEDDDSKADNLFPPFFHAGLYPDLQNTKGIYSSPQGDKPYPSGAPIEEVCSFTPVMCKAAETLNFTLLCNVPKSNILIEILQSTFSITEHLLPFNKTLLEPVLTAWESPSWAQQITDKMADTIGCTR